MNSGSSDVRSIAKGLITHGTSLSGYHPKTGVVRGKLKLSAAASSQGNSIKHLLRRSGAARVNGQIVSHDAVSSHSSKRNKMGRSANPFVAAGHSGTEHAARNAQSKNSFVTRTRAAAANSRSSSDGQQVRPSTQDTRHAHGSRDASRHGDSANGGFSLPPSTNKSHSDSEYESQEPSSTQNRRSMADFGIASRNHVAATGAPKQGRQLLQRPSSASNKRGVTLQHRRQHKDGNFAPGIHAHCQACNNLSMRVHCESLT